MNQSPQTEKPNNDGGLPTLGLVLGFIPGAIALLVLSVGAKDLTQKTPDAAGRMVLWVACCLSIACCFLSSFILFRRSTSMAILFGFVLFFVNAFVAFCLGCAAAWQGL